VIRFDFTRLLNERFVNPAGLVAFLEAYGLKAPKESAVEKWFQRGTVPSPWLPILLAYLEIEDLKPVPLARYLRPR
jgi:hypothetical protein